MNRVSLILGIVGIIILLIIGTARADMIADSTRPVIFQFSGYNINYTNNLSNSTETTTSTYLNLSVNSSWIWFNMTIPGNLNLSNLSYLNNNWSFTGQATSGTLGLYAFVSNASGRYDLISGSSILSTTTASASKVSFSYAISSSHNFIIQENTTSGTTAPSTTYMPPTPIGCTATSGSFWINTSCSAGAGNVTNAMNKFVNGAWHNDTSFYYNSTYAPHGWQNISYYSLNTTNGTTVNNTPSTLNTQISNNAIILGAIGNKSINEGSTLTITLSSTDADSDTPIYSKNGGSVGSLVGNLFTYSPGYIDAGNYSVIFGVSDIYGSIDNETINIEVINIIPPSEIIYTNDSTGVTAKQATLNGMSTITTKVWFEYGLSSGNYPFKTTVQSVSSNSSFSQTISGVSLYSGKPYYYRAAGEYLNNMVYGAEKAFILGAVDKVTKYDFDKNLQALQDSNLNETQIATILPSPYTDLIGTFFWAVLFASIYFMMWMRQNDITIPTFVFMIVGGSGILSGMLPPEFLQASQALFYVSMAGLVFSLLMKKRQ